MEKTNIWQRLARNKTLGLVLIITCVSIPSLGIGFWQGYDYKTNEIKRVIEEASKPLPDIGKNFSSSSSFNPEFTKIKNTKNLNELAKFKNLEAKVLNVKEVQKLLWSDNATSISAKPGTKLITIDYEITNSTKSPIAYNGFKIIDNQDRVFEYTKDSLVYTLLNSSIPLTGLAVYEIPENSTSYAIFVDTEQMQDTMYIRLK